MTWIIAYVATAALLAGGLFALIKPESPKERLIVCACAILWPLTMMAGTTIILAVGIDP